MPLLLACTAASARPFFQGLIFVFAWCCTSRFSEKTERILVLGQKFIVSAKQKYSLLSARVQRQRRKLFSVFFFLLVCVYLAGSRDIVLERVTIEYPNF